MYRPTPLFWVFLGLCMFWGMVGYALACDEDDLTDYEVLVEIVPTYGGWNFR